MDRNLWVGGSVLQLVKTFLSPGFSPEDAFARKLWLALLFLLPIRAFVACIDSTRHL